MVLSGLSQGQHMFFHLLGAGQPIANFTATSQTIAEGAGTWGAWPVGLSAWTRRRSIQLEGQAGALTNFPVRIKLDSTRVDYGQTQSAGQDLRFTDSSGAALSFEIENWDEAGTSNVWVKVPALAAYPTATRIWMYYGNAVASDAQAATAVWDANHSGVWHFAGGANDSTSNAKNGTATGVTYPTGFLGQALGINGTTGNNVQPPNSMLAGNTFSVGAWFKTSGNGVIVAHANVAYSGSAANWDPLLYVGTDGKLRGGTYAGANPNFASSQTVNDGQWHYAILTGSGSSQSLYLDGVVVGTFSGTIDMASMAYNYIGMGHWSGWPLTSGVWNSFNGQIDEVQISTLVRSADWIKANYASGNDSMAVYGSEETPTSGAAIITVQLNTPAITTITIPYTVSGTATAGTDHSRVSGNLTINGGSSSGSLNTYVFRDNLVEGSETAIFTLGAPTGASLGPDSVHTVTITDEVLSPPDAVDDSYNLTSLSAITLPVLSNDTDANGDALTITSFTLPTSGTLTRSAQQLIYTPSGDFGATDSFTYTISDGRGGTDTATVTLNYQIPFTWIGSGADANWTTTANWLGGAVPGASDTAYFNSQCTTYCNPSINSNVSVAGLRMNSSFSGTITQVVPNTVTVGTAGWLQRAGSFSGASSDITIQTSLEVLGGSYTSTSGVLKIGSMMTARTILGIGASAVFSHNNGQVYFAASQPGCAASQVYTIDVNSSLNLYDVTFNGDWASMCGITTYAGGAGDKLHVINSIKQLYGVLDVDIDLDGNMEIVDGRGGAGTISMIGSGAQTYSYSTGRTSNLLINKTLGSVTAAAGTTALAVSKFTLQSGVFTAPSGILSIEKATTSATLFLVSSGATYNGGTGTISIYGAQPSCIANQTFTIDVPSGFNFHNLTLQGDNASACGMSQLSLVAGRSVTVNGALIHTGAGGIHGTFNVNGNFASNAIGANGGTAVLNFTGTSAQSVSSTSGSFPSGNVTINKTASTLTLSSTYNATSAGQTFTLQSGIVDLAGLNLNVNGLLTIASGAKMLCNGGIVTAGSTSISGELSCGTSLGITWIGTTGDGLWSTAGNWTNNTIPGASDNAYFNGSCTNCNATVNGAISVKGIVMASSYTGTLTQGAGNALTVGASGWSQTAGTFTGSNAAIAMNGSFALSGGTFTSTSGTMTTQRNFVLSGSPTFNHNSGTVVLTGPGAAVNSFTPGAAPFWNVTFGGFGVTFNLTGTLSVNGLLTLADTFGGSGNLNGGTIVATGNVTFTNNGKMGTVLLLVAGSSNQTITGSATAWIPQFEIASTGGTVSFVGTLQMYKAYTYTAGTVNAGSSTLVLSGASGASNAVIPGTVQYNNVTFTGFGTTSTITGTMTVNGTLTLDDTYSASGSINTGTIEAKGNIVFSSYGKAGTGLIRIAGTGNQTVTGVPSAYIPNFEIASTGGVVTLAGTLQTRRNYTYTSGTVDAGTSTLYFSASDGGAATLVPGTPTYYNVTFAGAAVTFTMTGTLTVAGTLVLSDGSNGVGSINGGTILASGNVTVSNYGKIGTVLIRIVGSANQTLSGVAGGYWPETEIASMGGTVSLSGTLYMRKNLAYTSGTVSSGTSTVLFLAAGGTSTTFTPGAVTYNNVNFNGAATTTVISGTLTANGTVTFSDGSSGTGSVNSGSIIANGDIVYSIYGKLGSAVLTASGATAATVSMASTALRMPTLMTVNKSGGNVLTLVTNVNYTGAGQDVTVSAGTFDLSGYDLAVADVLTVGASGTLRCNGGAFTSTSVVNSGTINCPGYSGYEFNWTGAGGDVNWSTAGNWAGGVVPSATSVVVFQDTYCGANCNSTISATISVKGIQMQSPYTGTVTQASGAALTVGTRGWTQAAGTFAGSDSNITIAGGMNFTAGTFTSTSAMLQIRNTTTIAGTFNHNNGKLRLSATYNTNRNISLGTLTVRDLEFYSESGYDSYQLNLTGTVTVLGDLSFTRFDGGSPGAIYGGTLNVSGNITSNTNFYGSVAVRAVGGASQTITGASTSAVVPNLTIASTGGTVSVIGTLGVYQSLTYTSGVVSFGTSTVTVVGAYNAAYALNLASLTFNNLTFLSECARDQVTFTITGNLNVSGNLDFNSTCATSSVTGGQINVSGNLSTSGSSAYNGTTPIYMTGSGAATLTQAGSGNFAKGNLTINKSAGAVVTQTSNVALSIAGQNLTIQAGTLNMAGYNLNVAGTLTNSSVLQRGSNPSCGTITAGTYSGTAAICP